MLILVGLGNPGARYAGNRHNVGFMAVDRIAERLGATPWRSRFSGQTAEAQAGGEKILLLKPTTFMNESGNAVAQAMNYYRLTPADIVVFYDELDLAPGKLRMKVGGGAAGHNGIRSIAGHIGGEFRRARIGIGHPGHKDRVQPHVLSDFAKADSDWLVPLLDAIARHAPLLAEGKDSSFMNKVHLDTAPEAEDGKATGSKTESSQNGI
ncbi:MAG: aminoacyl-tRNA hydrolase [Flavobacteriaceae bacterium]